MTTAGDISSGDNFGKWTLLDRIGRGGNGQVWRAKDETGTQQVALKILTKKKSIAYKRFRNEVTVMKTCGINGTVSKMPCKSGMPLQLNRRHSAHTTWLGITH